MMENCFKIHPGNYKCLISFAHDFCNGCIYEKSSLGFEEDKRVKTCLDCLNSLDIIYENRKLISVSKDNEGKNIAQTLE